MNLAFHPLNVPFGFAAAVSAIYLPGDNKEDKEFTLITVALMGVINPVISTRSKHGHCRFCP